MKDILTDLKRVSKWLENPTMEDKYGYWGYTEPITGAHFMHWQKDWTDDRPTRMAAKICVDAVIKKWEKMKR